mmetsp:Transcript_8197/g.23447  ORF Transcript_8197/g.23447 Transcript_8197/m.23447 type:complete len:297 (-) Transcript_8197:78-968(-)
MARRRARHRRSCIGLRSVLAAALTSAAAPRCRAIRPLSAVPERRSVHADAPRQPALGAAGCGGAGVDCGLARRGPLEIAHSPPAPASMAAIGGTAAESSRAFVSAAKAALGRTSAMRWPAMEDPVAVSAPYAPVATPASLASGSSAPGSIAAAGAPTSKDGKAGGATAQSAVVAAPKVAGGLVALQGAASTPLAQRPRCAAFGDESRAALHEAANCRSSCRCAAWEQCYPQVVVGPVEVGKCSISMLAQVILSVAILGCVLLSFVLVRYTLIRLQCCQDSSFASGRTSSTRTPDEK